jgi:hypothetical protein
LPKNEKLAWVLRKLKLKTIPSIATRPITAPPKVTLQGEHSLIAFLEKRSARAGALI